MSKLNPTTGERRVGWDLSPSGNDVADGVKTQCAALIDLMSAYLDLNPTEGALAQDAFEKGCAHAMNLVASLKKMKVGIVMPTINLWNKYTKPAIDSVSEAMRVTIIDHDIECRFLLVDNASTDETQEEAPKIQKSFGVFENRFEYQRNEEMWGFQKSVNFGVNKLIKDGCSIVLVLNNDIILHPKAIIRILERFEKGDVSMVTCLDATGECAGDPTQLKNVDDNDKKINCPESEHPHFSAFAVSKDCWLQVGEFDEVFAPAYYEDNDYHYRMRLAGLKAVMYPPALFFHFGSRTQNEAIGKRMTDSHNQHMFYIAKWGGSPGKEVYTFPYNEPANRLSFTKQLTQ